MKKFTLWMTAFVFLAGMTALTGCDSGTEDPGPPPVNVIHPENTEDASVGDETGGTQSENSGTQNETNGTGYEGELLENAVSVRIGQGESKNWTVDMYNNAAAVTMLDYLAKTALLFPTYTYEEEQGFVAQSVRGKYTRDDEITVADIKAGELYLFSGNQLRFYFKDAEGVNITATPVGYFAETDGLAEAVTGAYESNLGDYWGVDVYFLITKTLDE